MTTGCGRGGQTLQQLCYAIKSAAYDTELTDAQWTLVQPMLPPPQHLGRPRTNLRRILNALLYVAKAGCQWRLLPKEFPAWQTDYHVFGKWTREHVWGPLVVKRTFGWLMRHRRLARDYETSTASAEDFVLFALIRIQIRRLV